MAVFKNTNTSNRNLILICMSYGYTGMNSIISAFIYNSKDFFAWGTAISLGIIMLCMIPTSIYDPRPELRTKGYVVGTSILHFTVSLGASYICSSWFMVFIYAVEMIIYTIVILYFRTGDGSKPLKK